MIGLQHGVGGLGTASPQLGTVFVGAHELAILGQELTRLTRQKPLGMAAKQHLRARLHQHRQGQLCAQALDLGVDFRKARVRRGHPRLARGGVQLLLVEHIDDRLHVRKAKTKVLL